MGPFIISIVITLIIVLGLFGLYDIYKKYKTFVLEHSILLSALSEINERFSFKDIEYGKFLHEYDNEHFYNQISPKDYLIYQLVFEQNHIKQAISDTLKNANLYDFYQEELNKLTISDEYDIEVTLKNLKLLSKIEKKLYNKMVQKPIIIYLIIVTLNRTNLKGHFIERKSKVFYVDEIEGLISRLNDKNNGYYNDKEIWNSICLVERGRVSNKMRFAVYARDNYRCKKCNRSGKDLEVDHIFPISKGGKSTFDNLQTLCKKCNSTKSNIIEVGTIKNVTRYQKTCPVCGAPLKLRQGNYGKFYGCMNYPKCTYTTKYYK